MKHNKQSQSLTKAFSWKFAERVGYQFFSLLIQIVLARILSPHDFGVLGIMIVFTALAQVFVQTGLPTALIQRKDITNADFSTIFYINLGLMCILYVVLFAAAPFIESFYGYEGLAWPFRVLCLQLFPCAALSVQTAIETRALRFKSIFISSFLGMLFSGAVSVLLALHGFGIWALVIQQLVYQSVSFFILLFIQRWTPKLVFSLTRAKVLFAYGWKLLASSLLESLYADVRSLIIGKKFSAAELGYYDKGVKFPQTVTNAINGTLQSVMLPVLSQKQDDKHQIKGILSHSINIATFIVAPMMFGLLVVAKPVVVLLLTEKWLSSVLYLQLSCPTYILFVIHTLHMQATNAIARTDMTLKIQIVRKILLLAFLIGAVLIWRSVASMIWASLAALIIGFVIDAIVAKRYFDYPYLEQIKDTVLPIGASALMAGAISLFTLLSLHLLLLLVIQVLAGTILYVLIAKLMKLDALNFLLGSLKKRIKKS